MEEHEYNYPKPSALKRQLLMGIARANAEIYRIYIETLKGNIAERKIKDDLFKTQHGEIDGVISLSFSRDPKELLLSTKITEFIAEKRSTWKGKTAYEMEKNLQVMVDILGDRLITRLTRPVMKEVWSTIPWIPVSMNNYDKFDGLTIQEAIELDEGETAPAPATAKKKWGFIKTFVTWLIDEEGLRPNLVSGLHIKDKTIKKDKREVFTTAELKAWFNCPYYTGIKSPGKVNSPGKNIYRDVYFWAPVITIYSGMRPAELFQMEICDVKQESGIWYFDVNDTSNNDIVKSLKSKAAARRIPIHKELIRLGYLDFLNSRKEDGNVRIFDEIKRSKKGKMETGTYSDLYGRKFTEDLKRLNLKRKGLVNYSLRHNFINALHKGGGNSEDRKFLSGHAQADQDDTYLKDDLKLLKKCIDLAEYDLNLDHLIEK
ncbi:site-specific integrase [Pseudemcibacter aquimaris]|uniref:site-specific integrase n=1 Tax=Pseudemcibacter aquimaris TaxID=2857064 RepID=UPI0020113DC4|nr:site-specific integrase [Pseudemcibacter aquimaris]MCC3861493.1 site-specific integrase [Pseudemcibacter aquimaris]WDU58262.1 site-specific integrase [Pseudemcibacter aquimaris]